MMVEDWQDKRATVSEAQREIIAEATKKMGAAWVVKALARVEGHKKRHPAAIVDRAYPEVATRRAALAEDIKNFPNGITLSDLEARHPEMNSGDISALKASGKMYSQRKGNGKNGGAESWYYPDKRPSK